MHLNYYCRELCDDMTVAVCTFEFRPLTDAEVFVVRTCAKPGLSVTSSEHYTI